jgi:hypothetical protein
MLCVKRTNAERATMHCFALKKERLCGQRAVAKRDSKLAYEFLDDRFDDSIAKIIELRVI